MTQNPFRHGPAAPGEAPSETKITLTPDARAAALERLAWLMDRAVKVPGTNVTVGLDALLGLLPLGGDVIAGLIQAGIVWVAVHHYKVPKAVAARMATNVLIDLGIGAIPFAGDLFDVFFKANTRNLQLLNEVRQHQAKGEAMPSGPSVRYLILMGALIGGAIVLLLIGFITLIVVLARSL